MGRALQLSAPKCFATILSDDNYIHQDQIQVVSSFRQEKNDHKYLQLLNQ